VAVHVGDGASYGLDVQCSFDGDKLLGTGGALRRALPLLGDVFWVLYGDAFLDIDYGAVFDAFARQRTLGLMTVLRNANHWDRSNVVFQDGKLLCYDKRNTSPRMEHIDFGASLFRREAVEGLPLEQFSDLADLMHELVEHGAVVGYEVHQRFYEIGSHQGLEETARYLQAGGLSN
jgi:NDP-sugar pyrophosphorylase family protein